VLVDALYFKAPWDLAFHQQSTLRKPFHLDSGANVEVDMMSSDENASYVAGRYYRGARLPYAGRQLAMTVALATGDEQQALSELLGDLVRDPGRQPVLLSMPRWTFRVRSDLTGPLQALGMVEAFDPDHADFSAMTSDAQLFVKDVLHQTFVAVDEEGTEAAAATAVVMDETAGVAHLETVVLDRPFLFAIHDTAHGTPLFVGRVADPS
jgi:serpin B